MKTAFILTVLLVLSCQTNSSQKRNMTQREPDDSARKALNGFGAHLVLTDNPQGFIDEWLNPVSGGEPQLNFASVAKRGEPFAAFVLFAGCLPDKAGICNTEVDFTVYKPDGNVYAERKGLELWKKQAPPEQNVQLSTANIVMRIRENDLAGEYKVKAIVRDLNRKVVFDLNQKLKVQ